MANAAELIWQSSSGLCRQAQIHRWPARTTLSRHVLNVGEVRDVVVADVTSNKV